MLLSQIKERMGIVSRTKFKEKYINPLLSKGLLAYTIPEKPTSSKQQYVTTQLGNDLISEK